MFRKVIFVFATIIILWNCESKVIQKEATSRTLDISQRDTVAKNLKVEVKDSIIAPKGSQIFLESVKLRELYYLYGYRLKAISLEECEESLDGIEDIITPKISLLTTSKDSFRIELTIKANCCSSFLCEAEIIETSTLNLIYHEFGRHCSCNCKVILQYIFEIDNEYIYDLDIKNNSIKYIQLNGNKETKIRFKK